MVWQQNYAERAKLTVLKIPPIPDHFGVTVSRWHSCGLDTFFCFEDGLGGYPGTNSQGPALLRGQNWQSRASTAMGSRGQNWQSRATTAIGPGDRTGRQAPTLLWGSWGCTDNQGTPVPHQGLHWHWRIIIAACALGSEPEDLKLSHYFWATFQSSKPDVKQVSYPANGARWWCNTINCQSDITTALSVKGKHFQVSQIPNQNFTASSG